MERKHRGAGLNFVSAGHDGKEGASPKRHFTSTARIRLPEYPPHHLLIPRQLGHRHQIIDRYRRPSPSNVERLKNAWSHVGQADHPPDEAVGDVLRDSDVLDGGYGAAFQLPPPLPRPGDGTEHMRVLRPAFSCEVVLGWQDLRPPVALADAQRDDDPNGFRRASPN